MRELSWTPEQSGLSAIALVPARTLSDTAKALAAADKVTLALAGAAGGDGLGAVDAAHVELRFTASTRPAVLAGKDSAEATAGDDYRYLLMPVRLSG